MKAMAYFQPRSYLERDLCTLKPDLDSLVLEITPLVRAIAELDTLLISSKGRSLITASRVGNPWFELANCGAILSQDACHDNGPILIDYTIPDLTECLEREIDADTWQDSDNAFTPRECGESYMELSANEDIAEAVMWAAYFIRDHGATCAYRRTEWAQFRRGMLARLT